MNHQHTPIRGMSLIELLVAMSILSIIAILCVQTIQHMIRHQAQWSTHQLQSQHMQNARQTMLDDMRNLSYPALTKPSHTIKLKHNQLQLFRSHWPDRIIHPHSSGLITVTYQLRNGCLARTTAPGFDHQPIASTDPCLLKDTKTLTINVQDTNGHWHSTWPQPNQAKQQARAIRIQSDGVAYHLNQTISIDLGQSYAKNQKTTKG